VPVTKIPESPAWTYELKFDRYRVLGLKAAGKVQGILIGDQGKKFPDPFSIRDLIC